MKHKIKNLLNELNLVMFKSKILSTNSNLSTRIKTI